MRHGVVFGLRQQREFERWTVVATPGDYMSFSAPWDSGTYDT